MKRIAFILFAIAALTAPAPAHAAVAEEVSNALFQSSATQAAELRAAEARFRRERQRIEAVAARAQAGEAAARVELARLQDDYVAQLAARDRAYAQEIAVLRRAVEEIAATPRGAELLAQRRPGHLAEVRALLDELVEERRAAEIQASRIRYAAEMRSVARLALDDYGKREATTDEVIRRFEAVTREDPSVAEDWLALTTFYRLAGLSERAVEAAQTGLRLQASARTAVTLLIELGRVQADQGRNDAARISFEAAVTAARAAAVGSPADRDLLIAALYRLGDQLFLRMGEPVIARPVLQEAVTVVRGLVAEDGASINLQRELGLSLQKLGQVEQGQGELAAANGHFEEALAIARRLGANTEAGDQRALRRELSVAINKLGDLAALQDRFSDARRYFDESLEIRRALARSDTASAVFQRDLAIALAKIGNIQIAQGQGRGASRRFAEAVPLMRDLVQRSPSDLSAQSYLAFMLMGAADSAILMRDYAAARTNINEAVTLFEASVTPSDHLTPAQRDAWLARVRLTLIPGAGIGWVDLAGNYDAVVALGGLGAADRTMIERARNHRR